MSTWRARILWFAVGLGPGCAPSPSTVTPELLRYHPGPSEGRTEARGVGMVAPAPLAASAQRPIERRHAVKGACR
jgi:hypothetical protein